jgi:hypothetical protein
MSNGKWRFPRAYSPDAHNTWTVETLSHPSFYLCSWGRRIEKKRMRRKRRRRKRRKKKRRRRRRKRQRRRREGRREWSSSSKLEMILLDQKASA